jgi:hypothetical protein
MARVLIDRERHQLYRNNETEEEANERRETHRELMNNYIETENEEETEERNEENRVRMELLRTEREEEEEMIRATMAVEQLIIIPQETEKGITSREQTMAARYRAGLPRTHRVACKPIFAEHLVELHDCGEMNIICEECGARHLKGERPFDKKFTQCCRKGKVILPPPKKCPAPLAQLMQNNHPKAKGIHEENQDVQQRPRIRFDGCQYFFPSWTWTILLQNSRPGLPQHDSDGRKYKQSQVWGSLFHGFIASSRVQGPIIK